MMGERASYDFLGRQRRGEPEDYARMLAPIWVAALFGTVPTAEARAAKDPGAGDGPTDGHVP